MNGPLLISKSTFCQKVTVHKAKFKKEYEAIRYIFFKGQFIYYVITFLGFLDPPPPLRNHAFSTENNQKLAFSEPPPPYK